VAKAVVDRFEMVEVEGKDADRCLAPLRGFRQRTAASKNPRRFSNVVSGSVAAAIL